MPITWLGNFLNSSCSYIHELLWGTLFKNHQLKSIGLSNTYQNIFAVAATLIIISDYQFISRNTSDAYEGCKGILLAVTVSECKSCCSKHQQTSFTSADFNTSLTAVLNLKEPIDGICRHEWVSLELYYPASISWHI